MNKLKAAYLAAVTYGEGHRTQVAAFAYAAVEALRVTGVLGAIMAGKIEAVLLPLAGATLAAKISRGINLLAPDQTPK